MRVLDERDLAVEVETVEDYERLARALKDRFGGEVSLEIMPKKK